MSKPAEYYVVDLRKEWNWLPCVTFWRPRNAGYAYPLEWAGRYTLAELKDGYHETKEGRSYARFVAPCSVVDEMAVPSPAGLVDPGKWRVVMNTVESRRLLRAHRVPLTTLLEKAA